MDDRFAKAQQDDPEVAEYLAALPEAEEKWRPAPVDFTLMHEMVAEVRDLLGELCALTADGPVAVKTRHTPPPPFPRPVSELEKARRRIKAARDAEYDADLLAFAEAGKRRWREQNPDAPRLH